LPADATALHVRTTHNGNAYCWLVNSAGGRRQSVEKPIPRPLDRIALLDLDSSLWVWFDADTCATALKSNPADLGRVLQLLHRRPTDGSSTDVPSFGETASERATMVAALCRQRPLLTGGSGPLPEIGGAPRRRPGPPQTMPYFYGPVRWRYHFDTQWEARTLPRVDDALVPIVYDPTVFQRILQESAFTAPRAQERAQRFGEWQLDDHVCGPVEFDTEVPFHATNPRGLSTWNKLYTSPEGDKSGLAAKNEVTNAIGPPLYEQLFAPFHRFPHGCDIHIVGGSDFMGGHLPLKLITGARPEPLLHHTSIANPNDRPDSHIVGLRKARFWAFYMHNTGECVYAMDQDPTIDFVDSDGGKLASCKIVDERQKRGLAYPAPSRGKLFEHISNNLLELEPRLWSLLGKTKIPRNQMYYSISEEEQLFIQLEATQPRKFYPLRDEEDLRVLEYKARSAAQSSRNPDRVTVIVSRLPMGLGAEPVAKEFPERKGEVANHWWLMIYDKESGILWDHNTLEATQTMQIDRLRANLGSLSRLYSLGVPDNITVRRANCVIQDDGFSCGTLALHTLWMFHMDRDAVLRGYTSQGVPRRGSSGRDAQAVAGFRYTNDVFDAAANKAFRRTLSQLCHANREISTGDWFVLRRGEPKAIDKSRGPYNMFQSKYFRAPWDAGATDHSGPVYEHMDTSAIAEWFQAANAMALNLLNNDHNGALERIRYHLENAGGVLFSFKDHPNILHDPDTQCEGGSCPHLIDIVPVPLNCKVILQG